MGRGPISDPLNQSESAMNIAIIGTGSVGQTLGRGWAEAGHNIIFGSRRADTDETQALVQSIGERACATGHDEAAGAADVVAFATPWTATPELADKLDLSGKIVIDCTNPLKPDLSGLAVGGDTSGAEEVATRATGARVVKAFNSTSTENMADPQYGDEALTMFICGDDSGAKSTVAGLAKELGFEVIDAGPLRQARYLEPLAMLFITLAHVQDLGRNIGFKLLQR